MGDKGTFSDRANDLMDTRDTVITLRRESPEKIKVEVTVRTEKHGILCASCTVRDSKFTPSNLMLAAEQMKDLIATTEAIYESKKPTIMDEFNGG